MVVQHNITAMNANRYYGINNSKLSKSLEKLSSGYAINRAGDNAAGLAVSEKMRSQIAGMTQGVKNAQDGISMVQTFEGALTETQSILQRMKTLADQSANGTYQDDVDRDAIQLEFDQLNDELNQIADTDYNGVVVLNGGKMADGTVAVDGKFDYTLGRTTTVIANEATDLSGAQAGGQIHTMVDQSYYDKDRADAVWSALGVDVNDHEKLDVTFMYDGERWVSQTVTDGNGSVVDEANAAKLEARTVERNNATGQGGFEVIAGKNPYTGKDIIATNVIFDEMEGLKEGDTVTVRFENSKATSYAPQNVGLDEDYNADDTADPKVEGNKAFKITATNDAITQDDMAGKVSFALDSSITDAAMDANMETALKALDAATFKITYTDGEATAIADTTTNTKIAVDVDTGAVTYKDDTKGIDITLGTLKVGQILGSGSPETTKDVRDATNLSATANSASGVNKLVVTDADAFNTAVSKTSLADGTINGTVSYDTTAAANIVTLSDGTNTTTVKVSDLSTWGLETQDNTGTAATMQANDTISFKLGTTTTTVPATKAGPRTGATGDVEFGLNVDAFNFAPMTDLTVHSVATPKVATMASQVAEQGVSVSNAYGQGTAPLTYTDNITLQTGARGKDAVNFTFKYTSGGIGNLKSNMDCSARENGLNTENLSLATAKDANYAIDQIDNAINKVSMVRGTFGAIQNRLEHKIDNMNVSIENLTDAESKIRDTDMSTEMMNFTKNQILAQAAQSMLAQANTLPQNVLSLLQ